MVINIRLTERDLALLFGIYQNVFLTFEQIGKRYFKDKSTSTAYSRISQLMRGGFLQSHRIGGILDKHSTVSCVYQITRKSLEVLEKSNPDVAFKRDLVKLNSTSLYHDYLLTEVLSILNLEYQELSFRNAKTICENLESRDKLPDAIIYGGLGKIVGALELELTQKSDRRYREIVTDYRLSRTFPAVVYVHSNDGIATKIKEIVRGKVVSGLSEIDTGRFYFVKANDLLQDAKTSITNGKNDLFSHPMRDLRKAVSL